MGGRRWLLLLLVAVVAFVAAFVVTDISDYRLEPRGNRLVLSWDKGTQTLWDEALSAFAGVRAMAIAPGPRTTDGELASLVAFLASAGGELSRIDPHGLHGLAHKRAVSTAFPWPDACIGASRVVMTSQPMW